MAAGISLILFNNENAVDISELVLEVQWKGRKGASSRSIKVKLLDDDGYNHARSGIDATEGHQCIFSYNGSELFRGMIMTQTQTDKKTMSITAYDNGIYLANNKDTFTYENKTAGDIFADCCTRFGLPVGEVAECKYRIPEFIKSKTTAFDAITDALSLDYDNTGIRHFVVSDKGKLSLITRRNNIVQWVIGKGSNLISYSYSKSISNIKTRVKMLSKEDTVVATSINRDRESKIGIFQDIEKPDEGLTKAQIIELANVFMRENSIPEVTLSVEALGIPEVISGVGVFIIIDSLGISRTLYVDSDTHTFQGRNHTMSLDLTYANDINSEVQNEQYKGNDTTGAGKQYGSHTWNSNFFNPFKNPNGK